MKPLLTNNLLSAFTAGVLFVLSVPVVMQYRIFPVEGTSYIVFLLFFLLNIANILYCLFIKSETVKSEAVKNIFTWSIILIVFVGAMWTSIADRGRIAPGQNYQTHDIILQLESAIRYVTRGKNPYKETYFGTPMEKWHYAEEGKDTVNPALYHFVMPPWYLLSAYPFYFMSMRTLGYFDGRMPLLFAASGSLVLFFFWIKQKSIARLAVALIALNPATIQYLIEGRSDFMVFFWFVLALYLLEKKKIAFSALVFAAAVMTKQTVWFAMPVVLGYQWFAQKLHWRIIVKFFLIVSVTSLLLAAPFLIWDWKAFVDSVIFYLAGNSANSYPISGYGLGMLLYSAGFIANIHAYYPFSLWQFILGLPLFVWGIRKFRVYRTISMVFIVHAVTLFVIWYTSRYFNNSHVAYISLLMIAGIFKYWDEIVSTKYE